MSQTEKSVSPPTVLPAEPKVVPQTKPGKLPPFNVILLNDDDHTYDYVIEMLGVIFGHARPRAFKMAVEVDATGRVIVMTTHKELAELKCNQILRYGNDPRIERCTGSMKAQIEPAS